MAMRWAIVWAAAILVAASNAGHADVVQVDVEGSGTTREEAIAASLTSAIEQVTGVSVKSVSVSVQRYQSGSGPNPTVDLNEESQKDVRKASGGVVRSYRVLGLNPENTRYIAKVSVTVEVFEPVGINPESRRKIAVLDFTADNGGPHSLGAAFRDKLIGYLTQTRRFAMVDRSNIGAVEREKAFIESDSVPITERVKLGQALGADYLIVGRLRNTATRDVDRTIQITGERMQRSAAVGEADYTLIDVATRQVKWAGSAKAQTASQDPGPDGGMSALLERLAAIAGDDITQNIYPMRVIKSDDPQNVVINQGGITVTPRERLQAMQLGSEVVDPYTKESLGRAETPIAVVEITRVTAKLSYGKLVSGQMPRQLSTIVLRRASPNETVHDEGSTASPTLKLPFDK